MEAGSDGLLGTTPFLGPFIGRDYTSRLFGRLCSITPALAEISSPVIGRPITGLTKCQDSRQTDRVGDIMKSPLLQRADLKIIQSPSSKLREHQDESMDVEIKTSCTRAITPLGPLI